MLWCRPCTDQIQYCYVDLVWASLMVVGWDVIRDFGTWCADSNFWMASQRSLFSYLASSDVSSSHSYLNGRHVMMVCAVTHLHITSVSSAGMSFVSTMMVLVRMYSIAMLLLILCYTSNKKN